MDPNWILAPGGRWTARDLVGDAAVGGFVFTYVNQTRIPKATAQDPGGVTLNTNPIQLDSAGEANIYWQTDEFYTIEVWSADPTNPSVPYQLVYSQDNYPTVGAGSSGDITINQNFPNLVRNPQFTFWGYDTDKIPGNTANIFTRLGLKSQVANDWGFYRNNLNATVSVSKQTFPLGQTDVPGSPVQYINYTCTNIGAGGETYKYIGQKYASVTTLSNTQVSFSFWAKSASSSALNLAGLQNFGSGGSPSPVNSFVIVGASLTPTWTQYTATIPIPSIAGKTIGTNGDDFFQIYFNFPVNSTASIDIANVQMHAAPTVPQFPYLTYEDQEKVTNYLVTQGAFKTGDVKFTIRTIPDEGWLIFDDSTFGSPFSGATHALAESIYLFQLIWNAIPNSLCPIYNSDGSVGTRGSDAITDFNADKRLALPRIAGRVLASVGPSPLGTSLGSPTTTLLPENLPPHEHEAYFAGITAANVATASPTYSDVLTPGTTGDGSTLGLDSVPINIIQPTTYLNTMIKL